VLLRPPKTELAYDDNSFCTWKNKHLRNENHNKKYKLSVGTGWLDTFEVGASTGALIKMLFDRVLIVFFANWLILVYFYS
jgi:hypothetical protein